MKVIFEVYIFSRIFKKRELRKNMYSAKISTFTVSTYCRGFFIIWLLQPHRSTDTEHKDI